MPPLLSDLLKLHWRELGVICGCLIRIWQLSRQKRWQKQLLALEQRRHINSQNETLRIALTAFASAEEPTLEDLLSGAERDWSLKSSQASSDEEEGTVQLPQRRPVRVSRPPPQPSTSRETSYFRPKPRP